MSESPKTTWIYFCPSIAWAFFIVFICLLPSSNLPKPHFQSEDLVVHLASYAIFAVTIAYGYYKNPRFILNTFQVFIFLALFGLMIEVLQFALPINRQFALSDFFFNALGGSMIFAQKNLNRIFIKLNL